MPDSLNGVRFILVVFLTATISGCASDVSPPDTGGDTSLDFLLESAIEEGVSEAQIAVLERAIDKGGMAYVELESLVPAVVECLESAGIDVHMGPPTEIFPGVFMPGFLMNDPMGRDFEEAVQLSMACEHEHWGLAKTYYLDQPSSVAALDDWLIRERGTIRACLAERDIVLDAAATADEIKIAIIEDGDLYGHLPDWESCYTGGRVLVGP